MTHRALAFVSALFLALAGCGQGGAATPAPARAPASGGAGADLAVPDPAVQGTGDVVASGGGVTITTDDFLAEFNKLSPRARTLNNTPEKRKDILDRLVQNKLIVREAVSRGMDRDPAILAKVRDYYTKVLTQELTKKVMDETVEISDAELQKYYDENPQQFTRPAQIRASHILVRLEPNASEESKKAARDKAEAALKEIRGGKAFEEVVAKYSDGPTTPRGGDLGYFSQGRMVPEFEDAAFKLEKDAVSEVVETKFGFHIIKVTDKRPEEKRSLDDSKETIKRRLSHTKRKEAYDRFLADLKAKAPMTVNEERLEKAAGESAAEAAASLPQPQTLQVAPGAPPPPGN